MNSIGDNSFNVNFGGIRKQPGFTPQRGGGEVPSNPAESVDINFLPGPSDPGRGTGALRERESKPLVEVDYKAPVEVPNFSPAPSRVPTVLSMDEVAGIGLLSGNKDAGAAEWTNGILSASQGYFTSFSGRQIS